MYVEVYDAVLHQTSHRSELINKRSTTVNLHGCGAPVHHMLDLFTLFH